MVLPDVDVRIEALYTVYCAVVMSYAETELDGPPVLPQKPIDQRASCLLS